MDKCQNLSPEEREEEIEMLPRNGIKKKKERRKKFLFFCCQERGKMKGEIFTREGGECRSPFAWTWQTGTTAPAEESGLCTNTFD